MKNFIITEQEKSRILDMHKEAIKRSYLIEQPTSDLGGGGTPQDKLQNFTISQTKGSIPSLNQKVLRSSVIISDVNNKTLQFDANFDTQTNIQARYIIGCQQNKKGGFSLATNTPDKLTPSTYYDLKTSKVDDTGSYGAQIEPKKGELFNFLNSACNAAFSTKQA